ncbi:LysR family transcriptional regulator [Segeticoccus rhizosphaerae]|uniref:LysR family transcriptional regulator n=1 Tax=Segeticoccus rhizosphaerae TaxID=1104777 RepID=UPI0010C0490B|nr:LysR family transcriptional regulator [Ornithinicoccus soli]
MRTPDLTALRLLVDVGSLGSLGAAARQAQISQPAASKRIARLERDLGLMLVRRSATGSRLTTQGQVVVDWASQVLDTVDHLLGAVNSLHAGADTDLRVAASMTIAEHLMPRWLFETRAKHPDLHVGLEVTNSEQVQELVLAGSSDIGFVEGPRIDRRLHTRAVAVDRLVVVVAPEHSWTQRRRPLRREDLAIAPLVVREPGSGTRLTLEEVMGGQHAAPLLELGSNEAVKGAVTAGAGAAVLSVLAVGVELAEGRLVEMAVRGVDMARQLTAVWPRANRLSQPSRWLLDTAVASSGRRSGTDLS